MGMMFCEQFIEKGKSEIYLSLLKCDFIFVYGNLGLKQGMFGCNYC